MKRIFLKLNCAIGTKTFFESQRTILQEHFSKFRSSQRIGRDNTNLFFYSAKTTLRQKAQSQNIRMGIPMKGTYLKGNRYSLEINTQTFTQCLILHFWRRAIYTFFFLILFQATGKVHLKGNLNLETFLDGNA